jgi:O-antigen/teichoic acid export membrane protein
MNAGSLVKKWKTKYTQSLLLKRLFTVLSIDILVKLSSLILLPFYLRIMTQAEYGLYNYWISIVLTFSIVLNFGLYIPISKYYHDHSDPHHRGQMLFTILSLLVVILAALLVPVYLFRLDYTIVNILFKNPVDYQHYRFPILLALVGTVANFMLTNFFFISEKIDQLKRYNITRIICINTISILAVYLLKQYGTVAVRLEATYLVEAVLFLVFVPHVLRELKRNFNKQIAIAGFKLALPVMISAIFGIVINFSDKFFLEKYGSFKDLSYYYLAVTCASIIPLIFGSFQNAWLPLFLKEKDVRVNIRKTNKVLLRLFGIFLILSLLIIIFVKTLLALGVIQHKYDETLYILPILLASQIFSAMVPLYSNYMIYFEKTYIISLTGVIVCIVNVCLSLLLISDYGVYGAGIVSLASNACYFITYYAIVKHLSKKYVPALNP